MSKRIRPKQNTKSQSKKKGTKITKTKLAKTNNCCQELNPRDWIFKKLEWNNKAFYTKKIWLFFNRPIGIKNKIKEALREIKKKKYETAKQIRILQKTKNMFSVEIMIEIKKKPTKPDPAVKFLNGTYLTEYFQGDYSRLKNRIALFLNELSMKNYFAKEILMWYVNCSKCSRKQGGSVTILLAKVKKKKSML